MFLLHVYNMYEKDLICLFTVRKDFLSHFEVSGLLGLGKSENSHGKSLAKQNLTCLPCARDGEIHSCIKNPYIMR